MKIAKEPVEYLIKSYYREIFHYCYNRLYGDFHAAEDCTKEVMLSLYKKVNILDMSKDIHRWLCSVADKEIKTYQRKKVDTVDIDTMSEQLSETPFECSVLDVLNKKERQLMEEYLSGANKRKLAKGKNLTLGALYAKVSRIKNKIMKYLVRLNN
ncbi:MAG: sigma-70 family RNA polymerase sigma factor [Ruminococcus sp.]|nr:sigma-70 family RNA polymerase sigma factor [Ruminococcus sp.]